VLKCGDQTSPHRNPTGTLNPAVNGQKKATVAEGSGQKKGGGSTLSKKTRKKGGEGVKRDRTPNFGSQKKTNNWGDLSLSNNQQCVKNPGRRGRAKNFWAKNAIT